MMIYQLLFESVLEVAVKISRCDCWFNRFNSYLYGSYWYFGTGYRDES